MLNHFSLTILSLSTAMKKVKLETFEGVFYMNRDDKIITAVKQLPISNNLLYIMRWQRYICFSSTNWEVSIRKMRSR